MSACISSGKTGKRNLNNISLDEKIRILLQIINSFSDDDADEMKDILFEKGAIEPEQLTAMQGRNIKNILLTCVETAKSERAFELIFKAYNERHADRVENILSMNDLCQGASSAENKNAANEEKSASKSSEKPLNNISLDEKIRILLQIINSFSDDDADEMKDILFEKGAIEPEQLIAMQGRNIKNILLTCVETAKSERAFELIFKAYNERHADRVENILSMNDLCQGASSAENKNAANEEKSASKSSEKPYDWYLNHPELQQTFL